jgi:hypothetical protein
MKRSPLQLSTVHLAFLQYYHGLANGNQESLDLLNKLHKDIDGEVFKSLRDIHFKIMKDLW